MEGLVGGFGWTPLHHPPRESPRVGADKVKVLSEISSKLSSSELYGGLWYPSPSDFVSGSTKERCIVI